MTTDIARVTGNGAALAVATTDPNDALARLHQWVQAARDATALVGPLVDTPFVPDAYKPKVDPRATPEQRKQAYDVAVASATAAVLQGLSLGIDPLVALQQIYIVHQRPGLYAKMMVALVQSRGHEVWTVDGECTDTRAIVYGRRRGTQNTERVVVTMEQARKAGWTLNQAYTKTPADMLWNRAAARVCDRIASDVLKGIASVEEIQDTIQTTAEVGNGTRTVSPRRRPAPPVVEAVEDPPLEDETPAPAAVPEPQADAEIPTPRGITAAQQRKMHALLNEHGKSDRDVGLVYIAGVIGREISSTKELTVTEAGAVIDVLETEGGDEDPTLGGAP